MRSLSGLGLRNLAHRKGRSAMTALGIVLGVAILFGVVITNISINRGFDELYSRYEGSTDVNVRPLGLWDSTFSANKLTQVRSMPGVARAGGFFGGPRTVRLAGRPDPVTLYIGGSDSDTRPSRHKEPSRLIEGYEAGDGEIGMNDRSAARLGLKLGDEVEVEGFNGVARLRLVAIYRAQQGFVDDDGADFAGTTIKTARDLAGRSDALGSIDIELASGIDKYTWIADHADDLGAGVELRPSGDGPADLRGFLTTLEAALTFMAAIALFVGAFLIYLTLSTAVIERTRTYGTLRALGATRRQVRRIVLSEAIGLGAVSTVAGMVLGYVIALGLLRAVASLFEIDPPTLRLTPLAVGVTVVAGVVTTVVASLVPARRAARLSPVVAMRGDYARDGRLGKTWIVGAGCLGLGIVATASGVSNNLVTSGGALLFLLGAVLLVPTVLRPLAGALGLVTKRMTPGVGPVAVMHLVKERSRSAYTLALVMVVLAMVFTIASTSDSMFRALDHAIEEQYGTDLLVHTRGGGVPGVGEQLAAVPGVAAVAGMSWGHTRLGSGATSKDVELMVLDPETYFDVSSFVWLEGDDASAREALGRGGAVLLPGMSARGKGIVRGSSVVLATAAGEKTFEVAGIFGGFSTNQVVVVGTRDGHELFGGAIPSEFAIDVADGTDVATVQKAIEDGPGRGRELDIETFADIKAEAHSELGGFINVFWAILLVAVLVGLLGLANTLAMSVLQRYREIGVLRAIGTSRRQVRAMVAVEAVTLVLVAVVLAIPLGVIMGHSFTTTSSEQLGFTVSYRLPLLWIPILGVMGLVIAGLAGSGPARRAARLQVVQALAVD